MPGWLACYPRPCLHGRKPPILPRAQRKGCPFPNSVCFSQGPLFLVARKPGPSGVTLETGAWVFGFGSGTIMPVE